MNEIDTSDKIHRFDNHEIEELDLPESFTFPFYYTPHPLCILAAKQVQDRILVKGIVGHNFGLDPMKKEMAIGKMFGVLVIKDEQDELGFLAAFSGKLASSNHHRAFVPPVYDILDPKGFFLQEEEKINQINRDIEKLKADEEFLLLKRNHEQLIVDSEKVISEFTKEVNQAKRRRKAERNTASKTKSEAEYAIIHHSHKEESLQQQFELRELKAYWKGKLEKSNNSLNVYLKSLSMLKKERKERSSSLQNRLFQEYSFFNMNKHAKSLNEIFHQELDIVPPAGAGECAAPKLLHYAFKNNLKPIAMAEFWWGSSPNSEIRNHRSFYPACRSKCEPILRHMLMGLKVEANPMLENAHDFDLNIIYEDSEIVIINKPPEVLSVPGKEIEMSVLYKLRLQYPAATGPLLIHRLDMSTSGILIAAKSKEIHKDLQAQFMSRSVKKTYVALLDGVIKESRGLIDLPLRVDLDNRPRQLVCYQHGKRAVTKYEVINVENGKTRINFFPITGRTHQLRVHAAHNLGLGCSIVGDDLYGVKGDRLHLHAEQLEIMHPKLKEKMVFKCPAPF